MSYYLDKPLRTLKQAWADRFVDELTRSRLLLKAVNGKDNLKQMQLIDEIDEILKDLVRAHYAGEL